MPSPVSPQELFAKLEQLGIHTTTVEHEPVFTVEQAKQQRLGLSGGFTKNLFVRNKKGKMWLVVLPEDRRIDLKRLGQLLGAGRISFASEQRLLRYLGVIPGAVTPFGVINDDGGQVRVAIDADVLTQDPVHFHPLDNAMTTAIGVQDLLKFLEACNHAPDVLHLAEA